MLGNYSKKVGGFPKESLFGKGREKNWDKMLGNRGLKNVGNEKNVGKRWLEKMLNLKEISTSLN
tara:strand:- start:115 stop:306 length:192 start_codon:yes stop_codon:yes gene_type:complete